MRLRLNSLGLAVAISIFAAGASAAAAATTTIDVGAQTSSQPIPAALLGSDYLYPLGGMDSFDSATDAFDPSFLHDLSSEVFTGSLRFPGGITADYYQWKRAIGPQSQRTDNAYGPTTGPSPDTVGPDEFGQLLDDTGASGVMTVNFTTGSAQDAADEVAYMTGTDQSNTWVAQRAANGHAGPYDVPVWEVGNEEYSTANSWRGPSSTFVSLGTPTDPAPTTGPCAGAAAGSAGLADCEYIYGGTTSFSKQGVVLFADRDNTTDLSDGTPSQKLYVRYPPVDETASPATVFVGGTAWTEVGSLQGVGDADDYTLDDATGQITFGDGAGNGAIPTEGEAITVTYRSGPHDGFNAYYQAMKTANPNIQVCATDTDQAFIADMGSANPYDCLQYHPYETDTDSSGDIADFEKTVMAAPEAEVAQAQMWQSAMQSAAGHAIPLDLSEYGSIIGDIPDPTTEPFYYDSLDEALLNASQLADWIELGDVDVADRQLLTAQQPQAADVTAGLPDSAPFATTGAIVTPGTITPDSTDTEVQPTGQYFALFKPLAGGTLLGTTTLNNPQLTTSGSTAVGDLSVVAAENQSGDEIDTVVINRSPTDSVSTELELDGASAGQANVTTLNASDGGDALSTNLPDSTTPVTTTQSTASVSDGTVDLTIPAHSISLVQASGAPGAAPAVAVAAANPIVTAGGDATVTATISNPTSVELTGTASLVLPDGWTGDPAHAFDLQPGASATVSFDVSAPAGAAAGDFTIGVSASANGTAAAVGTVPLTVPAAQLSATYDNVGITDDDDDTAGEYDGVQDSFSSTQLAGATPSLTPGASFTTSDGLSFTWPDAAAGTPDNTLTEGQTVAFTGSGTELGFVGTGTTSPPAGTGTVHYTDGSTSSYTLNLGAFFDTGGVPKPASGNDVVVKMPSLNDSNQNSNPNYPGERQQAVAIFEQSVPITPGKTIEAITLPNDTSIASGGRITALHVFAIAVNQAPAPGGGGSGAGGSSGAAGGSAGAGGGNGTALGAPPTLQNASPPKRVSKRIVPAVKISNVKLSGKGPKTKVGFKLTAKANVRVVLLGKRAAKGGKFRQVATRTLHGKKGANTFLAGKRWRKHLAAFKAFEIRLQLKQRGHWATKHTLHGAP